MNLVLLFGTVQAAVAAAPASPARQAAQELATVLTQHDVEAVAGSLTHRARAEWLGLLAASDRLEQAHRLYQDATSRAFSTKGAEAPESPLRVSISSIGSVDVQDERPIDPSTVELSVRFEAGEAEAVTSLWRAVKEVGEWRIELPGCNDAAQTSALAERLERQATVIEQIARDIAAGKYPTVAEAQAALRRIERPRKSYAGREEN